MSTITADAHAHSHAEHAHARQLPVDVRFLARSQDHRDAVPVQHAALVFHRRPAGARRALAVGVSWSDMPILGKLLFSAEGGQIAPETYTMLFTMHATVMIFLVIIPILAGAFGNFLIPLMIGAEDMAFPTLNMLSYWFMWPAFICVRRAAFSSAPEAPPAPAGRRTRRCRSPTATAQTLLADRAHVRRRVVDDGLGQLPDDDHPDAGPRHDDVPPADDDLGHVHHGHPAGLRPAGAHGGRLHAIDRPHARHRLLHSRRLDGEQHRCTPPAAGSRCCGSTCSGSTATRPCTS